MALMAAWPPGRMRRALGAGVLGGEDDDLLNLTATTTSDSESVTIDRMEPAAGVSLTIRWGDGNTTTSTDDSSHSHTYATAGEYAITVTAASSIVGVDLRGAKLGGLDTRELRGSAITYWRCQSITDSTIDSADMASWTPNTWLLSSMPAGTYTIDSADMASWTPTTWWLSSMPAGTYTIDSADMASWTPGNWWLYSMPAGTYTFDSADMASWTPGNLRLYSMPSADTSWTIAASDFTGWTTTTTIQAQDNGWTQAQVDAMLWGMYQASRDGPRIASGGTINVGGSNAAPSGTFQAASACPVDASTGGKEVAHELLNDGCGEGFNVWDTVTVTA